MSANSILIVGGDQATAAVSISPSSATAGADTVHPACYNDCPFLYTQSAELSTGLCDSTGLFAESYQECDACLKSDTSSGVGDIRTAFSSLVSYCAFSTPAISALSSSRALSPSETTSTTFMSSKVSKVSSSSPATLPTSALSSPQSAAPHPSNKIWIAGVVVGPLVFVAALIIVIICVRRRKKSSGPRGQEGDTSYKNHPYDKAQLHSDCIPRATLYELSGGDDALFAELPAREPAGAEMQDTKLERESKSTESESHEGYD